MKTINNFIVEHLEYSTFPINEKLKISSKSNMYTCQPKDKFELREILEERLSENKNADLNDIDVSEITDIGWHGFPYNTGLFEDLDPHNIDISEWNVSNVTDMRGMFKGCKNFNADLSKWDVSNVIDMSYMFYKCKNFNSDLSKWNTSKVTNMSYMFKLCTSFNSDIGSWNVRKVKDMSGMFSYSSFDGDISKWLPKSLKYASEIYYKCPLDFHNEKHFIL